MEGKQSISLIDDYLARVQKPLKGLVLKIAKPTGVTNLQASKGVETLDSLTDKYRMIVSAVKYSALVIPLNPKQPFTYDLEDEIKGTPEKRFVYEGNATIYQNGSILIDGDKEKDCRQLMGWQFVKQGSLWLSSHESNLERAIFGQVNNKNKRESIIKSIVDDYQKREDKKRTARERDRESQFEAGVAAGEPRRCF